MAFKVHLRKKLVDPTFVYGTDGFKFFETTDQKGKIVKEKITIKNKPTCFDPAVNDGFAEVQETPKNIGILADLLEKDMIGFESEEAKAAFLKKVPKKGK